MKSVNFKFNSEGTSNKVAELVKRGTVMELEPPGSAGVLLGDVSATRPPPRYPLFSSLLQLTFSLKCVPSEVIYLEQWQWEREGAPSDITSQIKTGLYTQTNKQACACAWRLKYKPHRVNVVAFTFQAHTGKDAEGRRGATHLQAASS